MEKAVLVSKVSDIKAGFERIYFGNEFCERLIPTLSELDKWQSLSAKSKKGFTFLTPYVTQQGLEKLTRLFAFLDGKGKTEVVFNDWGVFNLLRGRFRGLIPVLGRLLTKQRRDPRMLRIFQHKSIPALIMAGDGTKHIYYPKKVPDSLFRHYQGSVINSPVFQRFLLDNGIRRVEIDNLVWEMNVRLPAAIAVSVYFPYGYITTTRRCRVMASVPAGCKKECRQFYLRLKNKNLPVPFYSAGNTVFYRSAALNCSNLLRHKEFRVVHQPRLPF